MYWSLKLKPTLRIQRTITKITLKILDKKMHGARAMVPVKGR